MNVFSQTPEHRFEETQELPALEVGQFADDAGEAERSPVPSIARNAIIVGIAFILSRILGVVREIAIAAQFGTSADYDAYVAAFRIPDLLFLIVMSGAFGSAFIPVFAGFIARRDERGAWRLASAVLSITLVVLIATSLLVLAFAGPLVSWIIAPGLDTQQKILAVDLTRLLLLSPLLLGLGIAFKGILEAQERFALAAFAPVFYNAGIIFGAVALTGRFGIFGLALGVILGAGLHAGIQFAGLLRGRIWLEWLPSINVPGIRTVGGLMAPRVIGQAAFQVNFIVMTNFASRLSASSVGALNYAFQLFMLPYGVLALSLSTVIFPRLSRQFELGQLDDMKLTLSRALSPLIFLSLPAAIGLLTYRQSIVQVLFEIGSFDAESTNLVAGALAYFSLGLLGWALIEALTRAFYAMQDTRTPVTISVSAVVLNVLLSWLLSREMGYRGLALALSIASTVEALALVVMLQIRIGIISRDLVSRSLRSVLAGSLFLPYAIWTGQLLADATDPAAGRTIGTYLLFTYGLGTAVAVFATIAFLVGVRDIQEIGLRIPVVRRYLRPFLTARYGPESTG
ncbi:MAG: murein biosynthesis integral membrane protein MurJ [Thermomicrobiales bacterium]